MSNPDLPAELLDKIVDLLHNDTYALQSCCLVSKSWIARTRKHLFAEVVFSPPERLQAWKDTFPDPSTSPARYTKSLTIGYLSGITPPDKQEGGWVTTFSRVEHLEVRILDLTISLVPLHGFLPLIKSLRIDSICPTLSPISNLIYSFPLLEDLIVEACSGFSRSDYFDKQLTSTRSSSPPPFTGTLKLPIRGGMHRVASALLSLPSGLHFRKLDLTLRSREDVSSAIALVDECSSTLESIEINYDFGYGCPYLIDLSKAANLRIVGFVSAYNPRWITMALRTIGSNHPNFQQISIYPPDNLNGLDPAVIKFTIGKTAYLEWLDLDRLLAEFHELYSIHLKALIWIDVQRGRGCVECLLPEVTARGIIDLERFVP